MKKTKTYPEWVLTDSERKMHDDFRVFLWVLWKHLGLPAPTPLQYDIADYVSSGPRRRMVQAFRGAAKTWITCAYVLWRFYRNPNERVKIVSANEPKAVENATFIRRLIDEVEFLRFLRPRQGQRDATMAFDVGPSTAAVTPSCSCVGITGQLTGGRATLLVSDDVEVPKNSFTEAMRERLAELIKEYDAIVVPEGFDIVYLGTPQTEQSIYNIVRTRGYDCRVWPVRYPFAGHKYGASLAPMLVKALLENPKLAGTSTEPSRFHEIDLGERELSYGRSSFALQYLLDTSLSDAQRYPLKTADLVCMDVDREVGPGRVVWTSDPRGIVAEVANVGFAGDRLYRPLQLEQGAHVAAFQGRILIVDPSGRGKDETAYVVLYQLNGLLFLKEAGGFNDGYSDETLDGLARIAETHKVHRVLVESNMGDGMFGALLKPHLAKHHPCSIEEVRATGQKERRIIEDLEPVLNQHRLVIDLACAKRDVEDGVFSLLYQLTHITKDRGALKHDDRLDALAHGVRFFRTVLAQDVAKAEQSMKDKAWIEEQRKWMQGMTGKASPKARFQQTNRASRR